MVVTCYKKYLKKKLAKLGARITELEKTIDVLIESPRYISSDNVGFNGQILRKKIFRDLITGVGFTAIVETGTSFGDTTEYMAEVSGLTVYSCELNRRIHLIAKRRLSDFKNIHLELSDSPLFLNKLANSTLSRQNSFPGFYST